MLSWLGAGYRSLLADYFWIQTLQAVSNAQTPEQYRDIYDYANLVISLDPKFHPIYVFAGATLPVQDRSGAWRNVRESTEVLERGMQAFPDFVFLRILLAYNINAYDHDHARAAALLAETAKLPGAPTYLGALAAKLYGQAGEFETGFLLAKTLARTAEDETTRAEFERRAKELQLDRILREVDRAVEAFHHRAGRPPSSIEELVSANLLTQVPPDPLGGTLVIDAVGRARSTADTRKQPTLSLSSP